MASAAAAASSEMLEATDIEELEVTETDAALLRELLEEEEEEEEYEEDRVKQIVGVLENELNANSDDDDDDKHDRLKRAEELNIDDLQYYWPEMVDMTPNSPLWDDETMAWYIDEFDCNIDYSQLYSGVFFEAETTYGCLWQD
ncbi:hypothetical protein CRYUN_Cryun01aG0115000 [Craigia yunnanensis]